MRAQDFMSRDFRVVEAEWAPAVAHSRMELSESPHVVVRQREGGEPSYYYFELEDLLRRLARSSALSVSAALELHESWATRTVAPIANAGPDAPLIVLGAGTPVGVIAVPLSNVTAPVPLGDRARGTTIRATRGSTGGSALAGTETHPVANASELVTRHLTVTLPAAVTTERPFWMTVDLTAQAEPGSAATPFAKPVGTKIVVLIQPREGLSVIGNSDGEIEVVDPQPEAPLTFQLKAGGVGTGKIRVLAVCDGTTLAALTLTTSIVESAEAAGVVEEKMQIDAGPRSQPDLTVCIFERERTLDFELWSADGAFYRRKFGPVDIKVNPQEYFRSQFRDIESLRLDTAQQRKDAQDRLARKGANLFDQVIPAELKALLWDMRERITTVQISSDEPWIPWEFCRLKGKQDGRVVEGKFFAEAFWVTRWLTGAGPPRTITIDNLALVVPGDSNLAQAPSEKAFMLGLANGKRKVTELWPTYATVTQAMEKGEYDAWHFTGHARADQASDADQSVIELAERDELKPEDIAGAVENVLHSRPFIFLNACQSAQAGVSLTGLGGWAKRFIQPATSDRTASAFVGTYWSVYDDAALAFTKALYHGLLSEGKPIGQAARDARLAIRNQDDPTWLAYTVYADPFATVKRS